MKCLNGNTTLNFDYIRFINSQNIITFADWQIKTSRYMKIIQVPLFFLFVLFLNQGTAQKCRYEKNEIDAVTEMVVKRTEPAEITEVNDQPLFMKAQCIGEHKYLKVRYYRYNSFTIDASHPFEIIFDDQTSVELQARDMPEAEDSGSFMKVSSLLIFNLTKDQYQKLMNKPAVQIKYFIEGGGYIRKDIRRRYQEDIQHILRCVLLDSD